MTPLQRIQREPVLITGVLIAAIGLATILGLDPKVGGGIIALCGALITLVLRAFVTPAAEVLEQQLPTGDVVTGQAATRAVRRRRGDTGASQLRVIALVAVLLAVLLVLSLVVFPWIVDQL